jgi:hypothetical protein
MPSSTPAGCQGYPANSTWVNQNAEIGKLLAASTFDFFFEKLYRLEFASLTISLSKKLIGWSLTMSL